MLSDDVLRRELEEELVANPKRRCFQHRCHRLIASFLVELKIKYTSLTPH